MSLPPPCHARQAMIRASLRSSASTRTRRTTTCGMFPTTRTAPAPAGAAASARSKGGQIRHVHAAVQPQRYGRPAKALYRLPFSAVEVPVNDYDALEPRVDLLEHLQLLDRQIVRGMLVPVTLPPGRA